MLRRRMIGNAKMPSTDKKEMNERKYTAKQTFDIHTMQHSNNAMMSIVQAEKDKIKSIAQNKNFVEGLKKGKLEQQQKDKA